MTHFDLAVLGTGSGNMIVGRRFRDWSVAIVEENLFGGTCLNVGCIPTKMFVHTADLARTARHAPALGVDSRLDGVRWRTIRDRVFGRIDPIPIAERAHRVEQPNVTVYDGHARFVGERRIAVHRHGEDPGAEPAELTADQVVIAVGSRVSVPDIPGLDQVDFHTSDTIMRLPRLPRRLVIIGGGFVAAEFAHVFSAYGVEVVQLHRGTQLLRTHDRDVAARFTELAAHQWQLRLSATPVAVEQRPAGSTGGGEVGGEVGGGVEIVVRLEDGSTVTGDCLLVATGRVSNADRLDLAAAGVDADADHMVLVDRYQRTSAPGVWALGDAANRYRLKHVANREARTVRHNLLHPQEAVATDHRHVPAAVFTSPQIASVGLTEQDAEAAGIRYRAVIQPYADVAYGWAMEAAPADLGGPFVKLLADPDTGLLLGAHLIGPEASVLIQPLVQAMVFDQPVAELARAPYWIHPALSEVVENALLRIQRPQE